MIGDILRGRPHLFDDSLHELTEDGAREYQAFIVQASVPFGMCEIVCPACEDIDWQKASDDGPLRLPHLLCHLARVHRWPQAKLADYCDSIGV